MLCPGTEDNEQQLFIIVDNEVLLEVDSYSLSALFRVHYVVNLEYPKKANMSTSFLKGMYLAFLKRKNCPV